MSGRDVTRVKAVAMAALLVVSMGAAVVPASATQQEDSSTLHVDFDVESNAITDYTVDGQTVVQNVTVQSESQVSGGLDLASSLDFTAAGLNVATSLDAGATAEITTESGATIQSHDNEHGVLLVRSNSDGSQAVDMGLSAGSEAETQGDSRVVITTSDGSEAAVIATGDAEVSVTENGNVSARTGTEGEIVYRQYEGERTESDQEQEQLIADGTATAEVYVQQTASAGETASDDGQERSANVVNYGSETTVDVTQQTATTFNATVDRAGSEGRAVIMTVSGEAFEGAQNAEVYVDGEAAVEASSYSEIQSATNDGDSSAYLVQSGSAEATTDVVVGINHFSSRDVSMQSGGDDGESGTSSGSGPGFGATMAIVALVGAGFVASRRL